MNCAEFNERLETLIESRQRSLDFEIKAHVDECESCRMLWQNSQLLDAAIDQWRGRSPEIDLTDRVLAVMAGHDSEPASAAPSTPVRDVRVTGVPALKTRLARHESEQRRWSTVAIVAGVLLVIGVMLQRSSNDVIVHRDDGVKRNESPPLPVSPDVEESVADVSDLVSDARTAWRGFTDSARSQASDFQVFVPDLRSDFELNSNPAPIESPAEDKPAEPNGARRVFDFLFEASGFEESQTT